MGELKEQGEYLQSERGRLEGELSLTCRKMQMLESAEESGGSGHGGWFWTTKNSFAQWTA